jgi:hypothetical protein
LAKLIDVLVDEELEVVSAAGAMYIIDTSRVLNVLDVRDHFGRCVGWQSRERSLLPQTGHQIVVVGAV